jgi:hypothetical protein
MESDSSTTPLVRTKPRPNDDRYVESLRRMGPEKRLQKAFELTDFARDLFAIGLRQRHPDLPEPEFRRLVVEQLKECHNRHF